MIMCCLGLFVALGLQACGGGKAEKEADASDSESSSGGITSVIPGVGKWADAAKKMEDMAKKMEKGETVEPVNFRQLKEFLPAEAAGLAQSDASGETTGAQGFTMSKAEGTYKGDNDQRIKVEITDAGGIAMAMMGLAYWTMVDVDKEDKNGYERTTKIKGYKAYEKYNKNSQDGSIAIVVADRYLVDINGDNVSMDDLKSALDDIDLKGLANLKPAPKEE
jgi:hypothetical protein